MQVLEKVTPEYLEGNPADNTTTINVAGLDTVAPIVTAVVTPAPNSGGWDGLTPQLWPEMAVRMGGTTRSRLPVR